ncbi:MAG: T9SS type A sorting domain-containing protein [Flavobacteriales bacterium]|nr:T9SS type A sorting domain-containing protein [Flavobacteriales bacterium]
MAGIVVCATVFCVCVEVPVSAQPAIDWQQSYGGSSADRGFSIAPTTDGGYIVLGESFSNDGQVNGNHGAFDLWVLKIAAEGALEWQHCLGGSGLEFASEIRQTLDGGYILIGYVDSTDGDVSQFIGVRDTWVVKLDPTGELEWERSYGGTFTDYGLSVIVLNNGEYLLFGVTASPNIPGLHGDRDLWVARIDATGEVLDQNCFGGVSQENGGSFALRPDGTILICGSTGSSNGEVDCSRPGPEAWVAAVDENLDLIWQLCLGGNGGDNARAICAGPNGDCFVAISTNSTSGDMSSPWGGDDIWVAHVSEYGSLINEASFGGSATDGARAILYASEDHVLLSGITLSSDGQISSPHGMSDAWVVRSDTTLNLIWERSLGGTLGENNQGICFAHDGSLVVVGSSSSNDGDLTNNFGSSDVWVVKFQPEPVGIAEPNDEAAFTLLPNPAHDRVRIAWSDMEVQQFVVCDAHGRMIHAKAGLEGSSSAELEIYDWSDGMYTVSLIGTKGRSNQRFIKVGER